MSPSRRRWRRRRRRRCRLSFLDQPRNKAYISALKSPFALFLSPQPSSSSVLSKCMALLRILHEF